MHSKTSEFDSDPFEQRACQKPKTDKDGPQPVVCSEVISSVRQQPFSAGCRLNLAGLRQDDIATLAVRATRLESILGDGRRQVLGFQFKGETLHHAPPLSELRQVALTNGVLYVVNGRDLNSCGNCQYDAETSSQNALSGELKRMIGLATLLGRCTAMERIAAFLLDVASRIGILGKSGTIIILPMKRDDIADYLGLNAETVSRLFSKLKAKGVTDMPKPGKIILRDQAAVVGLSPLTISAPPRRVDAA